MRRRAAAPLALSLALAAGCGATQPRAHVAGLRVLASPPTTRVFVDDEFLATARVLAERPAALSVGRHLVTFTAEGYFPHDVAVTLPAGTTTVRITLRPIPP